MENEEEESEVKGIRVRASKEDAKRLDEMLTNLQSANQTLLDDKKSLETTLELVANKEFEKRKSSLQNEGYDTSGINSPEDLKALELQSQKFRKEAWKGEGTAPLSESQYSGIPPTSNNQQGDLSDREYSDVESMILDLNKQNKEGSKQAHAILGELAKKVVKGKPLNIELDSPMKTIARKPIQDRGENPQQFKERLESWKKSQKWREVGGNE